jgi:hypothetical protein
VDARELSPAALEILVARELRRCGIDPGGLRRSVRPATAAAGAGHVFDLAGRLEAYGRRWSALVECRIGGPHIEAADVGALRRRADAASAKSALLFTTSDCSLEAVRRADALRVALFRVIDAHGALLARGLIEPGPLPAWVPEFTVEVLTLEGEAVGARLLEADQPEQILRQLRAR